jgi:glucosamine--fructose-6-phosphate aminotransferase (isomerizing)
MPDFQQLRRYTYVRDLLDQPRALRDTVDALAPLPRLAGLRDRTVILTGMGGSYGILHAAHQQLLNAGLRSVMLETSELLYSTPNLIRPDAVAVVVSQSGASAEIVRLIEHPSKPHIVAVTNTADAPLARSAADVVLTQAGHEASVSCKTAVTAMAGLQWVTAHLTGADLDATRRDLAQLAPAFDAYLSRWEEHIVELQEALAGARDIFIVGRGGSLAAAALGGMIQKEAAITHGEGMSSAALRHGPFEMMNPECFVLVLDGAANVREMNRTLLRDALAAGAKGALAGCENCEGAFQLPEVAPSLMPVVEMLPSQMASVALADLRGREPGKFEKITKVTTDE